MVDSTMDMKNANEFKEQPFIQKSNSSHPNKVEMHENKEKEQDHDKHDICKISSTFEQKWHKLTIIASE